MFWQFFFLVSFLRWIHCFEETFFGIVPADNLYTTSITIPRHAYFVSIIISISKNSPIIPKILLRYNALPNPDDYDKLIEFHEGSTTISITDNRPTASLLYISAWGGELLHSYRYFAGSPEAAEINIRSMIETCDNELEIYNYQLQECEILPLLTLIPSSVSTDTITSSLTMIRDSCPTITMTKNNPWNALYSLLVPSNVFSLRLTITMNMNTGALLEICQLSEKELQGASLSVLVELYLDQSEEEFNYFPIQTNVSFSSICQNLKNSSTASDAFDPIVTLPLIVPLPLNGLWIVEMALNVTSPWTDLPVVLITSCITSDYSLNLQPTSNYFKNYLTSTMKVSHDNPWYSTYRGSQLFPPITSTSSLKALFTMDLTNDKYQLIPNGKAFQFSLTVDYQLNHTLLSNQKILTSLTNKNYILNGRIGNIPFPANQKDLSLILQEMKYPVEIITQDNVILFQANNVFDLLTQEAKRVIVQIPAPHHHNNGLATVRVVYRWTILHPRFSLVNTIGANNLYFIITEDESKDVFNWKDISPTVGFTVMTGYCPPNTCDHGFCMVGSNYITTSICYCKYPWAGESCDQLSVSEWFYQIQVLMLTISNLAMIPAILFSFLQELYLISIGLFFTMIASIFYHLCDTDYYCLWDLSFQSLQVMDILFCNVMITSVLLFYSPFSEKVHSRSLLIVFGLLLAFTVNHPTSPINLVMSFTIAAVVNVVGWLYYYFRRRLRQPTLLFRILNKYRLVALESSEDHSKKEDQRGFRSPLHYSRRVARDALTLDGEDDEEKIEMIQKIDGETIDTDDNGTPIETGIEEKDQRQLPYEERSRTIQEKERQRIEAITERQSLFYYHRKKIRNLSFKFYRSNDYYLHNDDEHLDEDRSCQKRCFSFFFQLRCMFVGILLGIIGLTCFILQNRENYWIYHSCWHIFVMTSSFFLLKGKYEFFEFIHFIPFAERKELIR